MIFSIVALLILLTLFLDSDDLPESSKAPPPALRKHLQRIQEPRANATSTTATSAGPLSAAIGFTYDDAFNREFHAAFYKVAGVLADGSQNYNIAKPVDASTAAFLEKHRDLLDKFYAWIARGGLLDETGSPSEWDVLQMAAADAEQAWRGGNPAEAVRISQALFQAGDMWELNNIGVPMLKRWIESGAFPAEAVGVIGKTLDRAAKTQSEHLNDVEDYWRSYARRRAFSVEMLEQPWHSSTYGFRPKEARNFTKIGGIKIPDPIRFFEMTIGAIRAKREAPEILAAYDKWNQQQIERVIAGTQVSFAGSMEAPPNLLQEVSLDGSNAIVEKQINVLFLCQRNLLRAGLTMLSDPAARPPESIDLQADPMNPWLNPFTNEPFQLIERDGRKAINSLPGGGKVFVLEGNANVLLLPKQGD